MKKKESKQEKAFWKEHLRQREFMQPFIDALYEEESEHESCGYDFGCIIESKTLWDRFEVILKKVSPSE